MGVAKKLKQPSKQQNPAKPKKETVAKTVKKQHDAAKPTEATTKKSSRIQNQKNQKLKVKSPQKLAPNKKLEGRLPAQSANNVQKDTTAKQSVRKTKTEKTTLPPNAKKTSNSKTGNNKKQPKALPKTAEVAKDAKASAKQTTKVVKKTKLNEASKSVVEKQSVSSKLQKKKRNSRTSPLKKTLNGKIVKGKKGSLGKKESLSGKAKKKKPRKSQLNLAIEQNRGVVYFSHLPHGMYENELKEYCTQFGRVTGVYVPRSVNGNARGYAFVEFQHPEVAEVVADTMNNYLMHTRLVKAELVPLERQKPWIFRNGKDGMKVAKKRKSDALAARTRKLTPDQEESLQKKQLARVNRLKKKLSEKGRDYEFTVVS